MMELSELRGAVASRLSEKRMLHTLGCVDTAVELAGIWGADKDAAYIAAMLHDVTKEMPFTDQLKFCEKHGIIICDTYRAVPELLHAVTGAKTAECEFGAACEVCDAIRWHTTGRAGMSLIEKVIWLADMTEPGRSFPGVEEIRDIAKSDIDAAIICGIDRTIKYLIEKGQIIDAEMLRARNFLIEQRGFN